MDRAAPIIVPRTPWPSDFPEVAVHCESLADRDGHLDFAAAKGGDASAALRLAGDLISHRIADQLDVDWGADAILLPVVALETTGFNAIPDAMGQVLAQLAGLPVMSWRPFMNSRIVQVNQVSHTRARGWHRLVTPALFQGEVDPDKDYILVDDHVGLGGTLANLRGYVESCGGRVVAMTTLTESPSSRVVAVRPETLDMLGSEYGQALEDFWRETFGHGLDCLTEAEAGYLCRAREPSVDRIAARMAKAAERARGRGLPAIAIDLGG
jgi:adenine/guanine phosphoribosyltransferase-like PRPP-binding protein